jgi:hypothetical protein
MAVAVGLVASAGQAIFKGAKKFLQKKAVKIASKAAMIRSKAGERAGKLEKASTLINKVTGGSDMGEQSDNPIKDSGRQLAAAVSNIKEKAIREGVVLGAPKPGMSMGTIAIAAIAALVLLPAILKKR